MNMNGKVTLIIPAHNEEKSIQKVIELVKNHPLLSEVIIVDNASTDKTFELAKNSGVTVICCPQKGKGYAMEAGIRHSNNQIIIFLDGDITSYDSDVITILTEPILKRNIDFVKSNFSREGGRVTELVAKPLLELLFPNIPHFCQPLSGAIAGKKSFFEKIVFEKDYGVDIGILLDMINLNAKIEEVYIGNVKNNSHELKSLIGMSKEVQKAILKRANIK